MLARPACLSLLLGLLVPAFVTSPPLAAQQLEIDLELPACLPFDGFTPVYANVSGEPGGSEVRVYFRRLHEVVEDFYYVRMEPVGIGRYYAVLPQPSDEDLEQRRLNAPQENDEYKFREAAWWRRKEDSEDRNPNHDLDQDEIVERADRGRREQRDWMRALTLEELENWLDARENEPAELYVAVYDAGGNEIGRSTVGASYVKKDCEVTLSELEQGYAQNLVVGETASWQQNKEIFHWQCAGVVTRIDPLGIKREDEQCRACVVAWAGTGSLLPLLATSVVTLLPPENEPVSPSLP